MDNNTYNRLVEGDEATWTWFHNQYIRLIRFKVGSHLSTYSQEIIEDVTQDVLLKLLIGFHTYDQTRPILPWLMTVTQNACSDWYRLYKDKNTVMLEEKMAVTPNMVDLIDLEVTLESLPAKQLEVLGLLLYGYSAIEIADIQKENIRTVYSRIHRLRKRVRELC